VPYAQSGVAAPSSLDVVARSLKGQRSRECVRPFARYSPAPRERSADNADRIGPSFPGKPGAPGTREFPNSRLLPIPTPDLDGDIQPNLINSTPSWPNVIAPPKGGANLLLLLLIGGAPACISVRLDNLS
jgi:hypothetical protein